MWTGNVEEHILFEDKEILVCHKPSGIAVQNARIGSMDMESALKNYLAAKEPGKVPYLGIVHRLDQPVEGVVVFAKTSRAAKELSRQMAGGEMGKYYLAVTFGKPSKEEGILEDFLKKDGRTNTSAVVTKDTAGGKRARLSYEVLDKCMDSQEEAEKYLLKIRLETGRHHQIRVQMSHAGMPLAGDRKYGQPSKKLLTLGLCSVNLSFTHPVTEKKMSFETKPKGNAFYGFRID